jgi:formate/nitrite transporter FocA (FNT family)
MAGLYHPTIMDNSILCGMFCGVAVFLVLEFAPGGLKQAVMIGQTHADRTHTLTHLHTSRHTHTHTHTHARLGPGFVGLLCNSFVTCITQMGLTALGKVETMLTLT